MNTKASADMPPRLRRGIVQFVQQPARADEPCLEQLAFDEAFEDGYHYDAWEARNRFCQHHRQNDFPGGLLVV